MNSRFPSLICTAALAIAWSMSPAVVRAQQPLLNAPTLGSPTLGATAINHSDLELFRWCETAEEAWEKIAGFYGLEGHEPPPEAAV